jgi:hypothetical protein
MAPVLLPQILAFILGPFLLAAWLDARLGERRPQSLVTLGAVGLTGMLASLAVDPLFNLLAPFATGRTLAQLYVAGVCVLVTYSFLAGIWLVRLGAGVMEHRRR